MIVDVARKLTAPATIGGYELPAGRFVLPAIAALHYREDLFPEPGARSAPSASSRAGRQLRLDPLRWRRPPLHRRRLRRIRDADRPARVRRARRPAGAPDPSRRRSRSATSPSPRGSGNPGQATARRDERAGAATAVRSTRSRHGPGRATNIQAPLKETLRARTRRRRRHLWRPRAELGDGVSGLVETGRALARPACIPASGGDGPLLCSGDMLLEALVACAGVTLRAVATSLGIEVEGGAVSAEGDLDFRDARGRPRCAGRLPAPSGSASISRPAPTEEQLDTLLRHTERYCVVFQTLSRPPRQPSATARAA